MPHQGSIDHLESALELVPPGKENDELRMHLTEALKEVKSDYASEGEMPGEDEDTSSMEQMAASHMSAPKAAAQNPYGSSNTNTRYSYTQFKP